MGKGAKHFLEFFEIFGIFESFKTCIALYNDFTGVSGFEDIDVFRGVNFCKVLFSRLKALLQARM